MFNKNITLTSPMTGKIVDLTEVPDEMFSEKMLGDGVAIEPKEGILFSPIDGEITMLFNTLHSIGITTKNGIEILIHIGIDTVNLKGKHFKAFISQGDKVKKGDKLISFNIDEIIKENYKVITPIVITNYEKFKGIEILKLGEVEQGKEDILKVKL